MRRQLPEMLHDERSADCGIPDGCRNAPRRSWMLSAAAEKKDFRGSFDKRIKRSLVAGTGALINDLALLKGNDGRDAAYAVLSSLVRGLVAVVLGDNSASVKRFGRLFKARASMRQGPHQGAQKSTKTVVSLLTV